MNVPLLVFLLGASSLVGGDFEGPDALSHWAPYVYKEGRGPNPLVHYLNLMFQWGTPS